MASTRSEQATGRRSNQILRAPVPSPVSPITAVADPAVASPHHLVIVAIPAYNEEVAIGSMVLQCRKYAEDVLVLDDGSTDRTADIARAAGARVVSHLRNEGKGAGIRTAFLLAKNLGADVLVLIDGDGQHNPDDIPALVVPVLEGRADVVNGSRFLGQGESDVPAYRRVGQEILTLATNVGTKGKITDTQSGFRAFAKKSFECFSFRQNGMAIESEMLMDAADASLNILEVPINVRYDVDGSTLDPVSHGLGVLNKVLGLLTARRPMLFYAMPGLIMLALGTLLLNQLLSIFNATHILSVWYAVGSTLLLMPGFMLITAALTLSSMRNVSKN
jgi:glycosyltransferase involved in cell wall biosynthesis